MSAEAMRLQKLQDFIDCAVKLVVDACKCRMAIVTDQQEAIAFDRSNTDLVLAKRLHTQHNITLDTPIESFVFDIYDRTMHELVSDWTTYVYETHKDPTVFARFFNSRGAKPGEVWSPAAKQMFGTVTLRNLLDNNLRNSSLCPGTMHVPSALCTLRDQLEKVIPVPRVDGSVPVIQFDIARYAHDPTVVRDRQDLDSSLRRLKAVRDVATLQLQNSQQQFQQNALQLADRQLEARTSNATSIRPMIKEFQRVHTELARTKPVSNTKLYLKQQWDALCKADFDAGITKDAMDMARGMLEAWTEEQARSPRDTLANIVARAQARVDQIPPLSPNDALAPSNWLAMYCMVKRLTSLSDTLSAHCRNTQAERGIATVFLQSVKKCQRDSGFRQQHALHLQAVVAYTKNTLLNFKQSQMQRITTICLTPVPDGANANEHRQHQVEEVMKRLRLDASFLINFVFNAQKEAQDAIVNVTDPSTLQLDASDETSTALGIVDATYKLLTKFSSYLDATPRRNQVEFPEIRGDRHFTDWMVDKSVWKTFTSSVKLPVETEDNETIYLAFRTLSTTTKHITFQTAIGIIEQLFLLFA
jgi:hypothetical protein